MVRRIELKDPKVRKWLETENMVSSGAVSMALSFKRNSPLANKIRAMALQNGGILLEEKEIDKPVKVLDAKGNVVRIIQGKEELA